MLIKLNFGKFFKGRGFLVSMFKKAKCPRCGEKVKKDFEFCPYCGSDLSNENSGGFLGESGFDDLGIKLPFGFKTLIKPLIKELNKQMVELDRELKKESNESARTGFSIHFGPGQKPVKVKNISNRVSHKKPLFPKISNIDLSKYKNLPRVEPETNIRRLSDRVVYELDLIGVDSLSKINFNKLENSLEIKAIARDKVFVKELGGGLNLLNYFFENQKLFLEFALK